MAPDASRARELLPAILMTLLSVVQALALEALWSVIRESPFLFEGGSPAWIGWLQVAAIFQGIIVVWLFYISIVLRFSWVPSTGDSVAPFVLGALELSLVHLVGTGLLPYWFYLLAVIFAFSSWISTRMFEAGLADPVHRDLAARVPWSRLDRAAPFTFVGALLLLGGVVHLAGPAGPASWVCLALANGLLVGQAALIHHYWRTWIGGADG